MLRLLQLPISALLLLSSALQVSAHGDHSNMEVPEDADWATRHMIGTL